MQKTQFVRMSELHFSIIIPVFNRPDEVDELLESLCHQTDSSFEIVIVEDGSTVDSEAVVQRYKAKLNVKYFAKHNEGPGLTRNYGTERASGNYFIFFDSDCLIPPKYIETVRSFLKSQYLDAYGGPDRSHPSFTDIQKAISYSMTAFLTTGGIRGGKKKMDVFHPRSFNMGFSKEVFEKTSGFGKIRFGEDLDMSLRIIGAGYRAGLIADAYVYHKRRTDFRKFYKQIYNSGIARINLFKRHPKSLKAVHFVPALFTLFLIFSLIILFFGYWQALAIVLFYLILIFIDAFIQNKSMNVAFLSIVSTLVQHTAYGLGFLKAFWIRIIQGKEEFHAYKKNFYK